VVKYTGLILYTITTEPKLAIPEEKQAKALAMFKYSHHNYSETSQLALAVVVGVLKLLVGATPTHIGHTNLQHLQKTLHPPQMVG
jgi:hypothetical protein